MKSFITIVNEITFERAPTRGLSDARVALQAADGPKFHQAAKRGWLAVVGNSGHHIESPLRNHVRNRICVARPRSSLS
jgi:hypothetical protein